MRILNYNRVGIAVYERRTRLTRAVYFGGLNASGDPTWKPCETIVRLHTQHE